MKLKNNKYTEQEVSDAVMELAYYELGAENDGDLKVYAEHMREKIILELRKNKLKRRKKNVRRKSRRS